MAVVPVSRELHGNLRVKPLESYEFARSLPIIRVLAGEIAQAAANFPLVFFKDKGQFQLFALLGLAEGENLFISVEGKWLGNYVPAMLRRYPFMLGKAEGDESGRATVLVEDSLLSPTEGEVLFGPEDAEPSGVIARAIKLLTDIDLSAVQTDALIKSLADKDLLDPFPMQIDRGAGSQPVNLGGLYSVSEVKLNNLSDEAFLELRRNNALSLAHAQILSLGQFDRLRGLATIHSPWSKPN